MFQKLEATFVCPLDLVDILNLEASEGFSSDFRFLQEILAKPNTNKGHNSAKTIQHLLLFSD